MFALAARTPAIQPLFFYVSVFDKGVQMLHIIGWLVIGAIAGMLAGMLVKGSGFGLIVDVVVGIVGAFIGNWLRLHLLHLGAATGWVSEIITAVIGAVILLFIIRLFRRSPSSS
jgi:uncharacterized membrane protein YeaQ/YmgE (transglycosylase-associated protein family)